MKFIPTDIPEVLICEPEIHGDERGYFVETFRQDKLNAVLPYEVTFIQDNESKSGLGVLRGLHYQLPAFAQTKLVRVIQGRVLDVAVDIRRGSQTFGQYVAVELSSENKKQLFVPRGFAHGFVVLEEETIVAYKVDNIYSHEHDRGIAFDDPEIAIDWSLSLDALRLSDKDRQQPLLAEAELFDHQIDYYA